MEQNCFSVSNQKLIHFLESGTIIKRNSESFRAPVFHHGPDKSAYNLGARRNWEEVFGTRTSHWFVPVFTSLGDGHVFPMNSKYSDLEAHFESTSTSDLTP